MKLYVLIAVSSSSKTIGKTLKSMSECNIPSSLKGVCIVENGGSPYVKGSITAFSDLLPLEYLFTSKQGKSNALNHAIENHIPEDSFIIFTDDDVRFNKNWLVSYEKAFSKYGSGHFFGSSFGVDYESEPDPGIKDLLPASAIGVHDSEYVKNKGKLFIGFNWAAYCEDIVKSGLFSPKFGPGSTTGATGQESEMQNRLIENGVKRVFIANNVVWHYIPQSKSSFKWLSERAEKRGIEQAMTRKNKIKALVKKVIITYYYYLLKLINKNKYYYKYIYYNINLKYYLNNIINK